MALDAPTATLIAGITTGLIGIAAAVISHLNLRYQLARAEREAERQRQHQILVSTIPKTLEATETIAAVFFKSQTLGRLTDDQLEMVIRALVWLPDAQRQKVTEALSKIEQGYSIGKASVQDAHTSLLALADKLTTNERR